MREELVRCAREKEVSKSTIKKLAERDTLTNLPGRMKFYEEAERAVSSATSFFRVGGDKFIILAPHTSVANAKNLTDKINKLVSTTKLLRHIPFMMNTGIA
ncbi:GGDEF domain-containing protein, partial [Aduncisulcus paluster]